MTIVLAGDVGGTKTYLSLADVREGAVTRELVGKRYASADYKSFDEMVIAFLRETGKRPEVAAFGIAGPVENDVCFTTNLPWRIDARIIERETGIEHARLVNDFVAVAYGIGALGPSDVVVLKEGTVDPIGPVAILGAGTGLGEAVAVPGIPLPQVLASEGGHTDFAPRNDVELGLWKYLYERFPEHISAERVISGPGLALLYRFVVDTGLATESDAVRQELAGQDDGAVIGRHAAANTDAACSRAVDLFFDLYGAEAGNLALKVLPKGGLFVAGGIATKLLGKMREGRFVQAFLAKGRMRRVLEQVRISVVTNEQVGLLGARRAALALVRS